MKVQTETVERKWLSYRQAMDHSSLGRTLLTSLVVSGQIPAAKVGKRVLIDRAGLDEFLRSRLYPGEK